MSRGERSRHSTGVAILMILLLLSPLIYVLSMGPVVALSEKTGMGGNALRIVYYPVIWLHDHTPLQGPLEWYGRLWGWG